MDLDELLKSIREEGEPKGGQIIAVSKSFLVRISMTNIIKNYYQRVELKGIIYHLKKEKKA